MKTVILDVQTSEQVGLEASVMITNQMAQRAHSVAKLKG
jgi:hypothetical protein